MTMLPRKCKNCLEPTGRDLILSVVTYKLDYE